MADSPKVRTHILPSDTDARDNVVLWDHGPQEPVDVERDSDEYKRLEAEAKDWHRLNGDGPVPVTMNRSDASHAVNVEPARYNIEPYSVDEAAVNAKVEEIQKKREDDARAADEAAARVQLNEDRRAAVAAVMAEKQQAEESERLAAKRPAAVKADQNTARPPNERPPETDPARVSPSSPKAKPDTSNQIPATLKE